MRTAVSNSSSVTWPIGPKKNVPPFMAGSIWERTEVSNADPFPISSYGLVGRLRGTGDSTAPTPVRNWMLREMSRFNRESVVDLKGGRLANRTLGEYLILKMKHYYHFESNPLVVDRAHIALPTGTGFDIQLDPAKIESRTVLKAI